MTTAIKPKMKPILFSTPMVQAILDGRKTMTRRIVKDKGFIETLTKSDSRPMPIVPSYYNSYDHGFSGKNVGDILWVRESYTENGLGYCRYKADWNNPDIGPFIGAQVPDKFRGKWSPSIHMPFAACRIFLKVTGVRVERLQDINPNDAVEEGIKYYNADFTSEEGAMHADYENYMWFDSPKCDTHNFPLYADPVSSFLSLWEKINGTESLKANPWVWVYTFERIEKP